MQLKKGTLLQGGKYRIERVLGQGGFGITYCANVLIIGAFGRIETDTKVAVKEFFMRDINGRAENTVTTGSRQGLFYSYRSRFIKEAQTLSRLSHPNIIKVLDLFEENNTMYYVMEFLPGGSLDSLIQSKGSLSLQEGALLVEQIASALQYMHANRMLHLDLKPANIMIGRKGEAVLIDFGLTKQFDELGEPESSTTIGHGTPGYAPIEQANYQSGKGFQSTIDIYALGASIFKMLTGRTPGNASVILNSGFPAENLRQHGVDDETVVFIEKMMHPFQKERYQTVGEVLRHLPCSLQTMQTNAHYESASGEPHNECADHEDNSQAMVYIPKSGILYYKGEVYTPQRVALEKWFESLPNLAEIKSFLTGNYKRGGRMTVDQFVERYKPELEGAQKVVATYSTPDMYINLSAQLSGLPRRYARLTHELSLAAFYLSGTQTASDEFDSEGNEKVHSLHCKWREEEKVRFSNAEGMFELMGYHNSYGLYDEAKRFPTGRHYLISSEESLRYAMIGGLIRLLWSWEERGKAILMLDAFPYDIRLGPDWRGEKSNIELVPCLIDHSTTIPARKSEKYDQAGAEMVAVAVADKKYVAKAESLFKRMPKEIECTVHIDANQEIIFLIKDCKHGEERRFKLIEMLADKNWKLTT